MPANLAPVPLRARETEGSFGPAAAPLAQGGIRTQESGSQEGAHVQSTGQPGRTTGTRAELERASEEE
jgi:hypothetical protein